MSKFKRRPSVLPSQEELHKHFSYDPDKGILKRADIYDAKPITGEFLSFQGNLYTTARIIYRYMIDGELPKQVLRVDGNVTNNKWTNITCKRVIFKSSPEFKGPPIIRYAPSLKIRKPALKKAELIQRFRYNPDTDELFFRSEDGLREKLVQAKKIVFRGITYRRTYLIARLIYANYASEDGLDVTVLNKTKGK